MRSLDQKNWGTKVFGATVCHMHMRERCHLPVTEDVQPPRREAEVRQSCERAFVSSGQRLPNVMSRMRQWNETDDQTNSCTEGFLQGWERDQPKEQGSFKVLRDVQNGWRSGTRAPWSEGPESRAREIVMHLEDSLCSGKIAPNLLILGLSEIWIYCIVG